MKGFLIAVVVLCVTGVLAACFRGEAQPQGSSGTSGPSSAPTTMPEATKVPAESLPAPNISLPHTTLPDLSVPHETQPDIPPPSPIVTEPEQEIS